MSSNTVINIAQYLRPKNDDLNLISAAFHMLTIALISMSMVHLEWFTISGNICKPYLTLEQFFWSSYSSSLIYEFPCINSSVVNMMRLTILLCFLAIFFALLGFLLDIRVSNNMICKLLRRYAVPGSCSILWIMAIISISYYIILLLEDSIHKHYSKADFAVTYGIGFYILVAAGALNSIGIIYNLLQNPISQQREDDPCILDGFENDLDTFNSPTPPPPYNIPPPPYTP